MKSVWVVNQKSYDLTQAEEFGKLQILTEGNVNPFAVDLNISELKTKLRKSKPDDYVLPCGSIPLNMLMANIMMELHNRVNLLIFDLRVKRYVTRVYNKEDIGGKA